MNINDYTARNAIRTINTRLGQKQETTQVQDASKPSHKEDQAKVHKDNKIAQGQSGNVKLWNAEQRRERNKEIVRLAKDRNMTLQDIGRAVGGLSLKRVWDIIHEAEKSEGVVRESPQIVTADQSVINNYRQIRTQRIASGRLRASFTETNALMQAINMLSVDSQGQARFRTTEIAKLLGIEQYLVSNVLTRNSKGAAQV